MTKNPLSLMVFDRDQSPRKEAIAIMNDKNFNNLIFVSIIVNCLLMAALYDPLDETKNAELSDGTDVFFTFLFMFEMFVKIVALGLLFGEEAYLRNGWNILDGIVVIISIRLPRLCQRRRGGAQLPPRHPRGQAAAHAVEV